MSATVLVTGATGFVGRQLVPALVAGGFRVRVALRHGGQAEEFAPAVERHVIGDIGQDVDWRAALRATDCVVHLAGLAHTGGGTGTEPLFDRVNREATARLAKAARDADARLVFVSSVRAQSGPVAAGTLTEESLPTPTDPYGRSKLAAEREIASLGGRFVILRPTLVYGPGVGGNMRSLVKLAALPVPLPFGAVRNARSVLAVDNLVTAIVLALTSGAALGGTFLVADRMPVSLADLVTHLRAGMRRHPGLVSVPPGLLARALRLTGQGGPWERLSGDLVVSTARLSSLGYVPQIDAHSALAALGASTRA